MSCQDRIVVDPGIRSGKPCVKGTRITVYDILEYLAGGMPEDDVLRDFRTTRPTPRLEHTHFG